VEAVILAVLVAVAVIALIVVVVVVVVAVAVLIIITAPGDAISALPVQIKGSPTTQKGADPDQIP
jgi:hypothetical protein